MHNSMHLAVSAAPVCTAFADSASGQLLKQDGLTHAWLSSSLRISPLEQLAFLERVVRRQWPIAPHAYGMTSRVTAIRVLPAGWDVHGKTGTGFPAKADGTTEENHEYGWFVGWAIRGDRNIVFARLLQDRQQESIRAGRRARAEILEEAPSMPDTLSTR